MKLIPADLITSFTRRQALQLGLGILSATAIAQTASSSESTSSTSEVWNALRAQLVLNPRIAYFDTATAGPTTRAVLATEYRAMEALHTDEQDFYAARYNAQAVQQLCSEIASWLNCSRDELILIRDAQAGLEQFASWFNFQPALQVGDELVISNQLPAAMLRFWTQWAHQRGVIIKIVILPSPLLNREQAIASFTAAMTDRSRVVVFSHVQHTDGSILPVHDICRIARERKAISVVDGALALGAIPVSIIDMECDIYASSFCHWLNGPQHTGVLYVRRELHSQLPYLSDALIETLNLNTAMWPVLIAKWAQDFLQYAPQYQALSPALSLQQTVGSTVIAARIHELSSYARLQLQSANLQVLTAMPGEMWSNILVVSAGRRNVAELIAYLRHTDQVMVSGMNLSTGAALRISFHIYNSFDDIDRLMRGLIRAIHT